MKQQYITKKKDIQAILIGVHTPKEKEKEFIEHLDELAFLSDTVGAKVVKIFTQKLQYPNTQTFVGKGKLQEIKEFVNLQKEEENSIDVVIFDDDLTPSQVRNIEKELECRIIDRTNLILDIFAMRAQSSYSKTQVELAQYQYLLPRLTRMWTHLERQKGGIGMRGPGETEIETDRRIIRDKITKLKEDLKKIDKQQSSQRKNRGQFKRVALVGYTNVGKSTIMNLLTKAGVFAENKLFATLDTTVRKVVINDVPFLLSDTVGFIRKLPHTLIESFKSTLDEVREADILLHIVDISSDYWEKQITTVNETLKEINAIDKPIIIVFNKIDAYKHNNKDIYDMTEEGQEILTLDELKASWMAKSEYKTIFISAKNKENIDELKLAIGNS